MIRYNSYTSADIADELKKISHSVGNHPVLQAKIDHYQQRSGPVRLVNRSLEYEDFLSSWGPYQFRIVFRAYRPMDPRDYINPLRRLTKSVNHWLFKETKLQEVPDSRLVRNFKMLQGFVVLHQHEPRPLVEIVCNVNQHDVIFTNHDLETAFRNSKCFESVKNPVPLLDKTSIKVSQPTQGYWTDEYLEDAPHMLSLNGSRIVLEY